MIARDVCQRVLQVAVSTGADYAEIFAENSVNNTISMIADKVENIKNTVIAGAAVRVYKGLRSVMASTVDKSEQGLLRCARQAAEALGQGKAAMDIVLKERIFGAMQRLPLPEWGPQGRYKRPKEQEHIESRLAELGHTMADMNGKNFDKMIKANP